MAAKKKRAKKKVTKKKSSVKKPSPKTVSRKVSAPQKQVRATGRKIAIVSRNLILFIILSLLSFLLYLVSETALYKDFFSLLTWILGFIALAFLITFLVLILLRALKK